jgi:hypothetical protein
MTDKIYADSLYHKYREQMLREIETYLPLTPFLSAQYFRLLVCGAVTGERRYVDYHNGSWMLHSRIPAEP